MKKGKKDRKRRAKVKKVCSALRSLSTRVAVQSCRRARRASEREGELIYTIGRALSVLLVFCSSASSASSFPAAVLVLLACLSHRRRHSQVFWHFLQSVSLKNTTFRSQAFIPSFLTFSPAVHLQSITSSEHFHFHFHFHFQVVIHWSSLPTIIIILIHCAVGEWGGGQCPLKRIRQALTRPQKKE